VIVCGRPALFAGKISPLDLGRRAMTLNISDMEPWEESLSMPYFTRLKADILVHDVEEMYRISTELNLLAPPSSEEPEKTGMEYSSILP